MILYTYTNKYNIIHIKIYDLIVKTIESLDYVIVKMRMFTSVLQIMIEKTNGETVTINDCERASRCASAILDTNEAIFDSHYNLEVSSTGINRPLTRPEDFERFVGYKVRVKTLAKIDDSKVFFGVLTKSDDQTIIISNEEEKTSIAIECTNIIDANLDLEPREDNVQQDEFSRSDRSFNSRGKPSGPRREGDSRPSFGDRRSSGPRREGDSRPSFGDRRPSGPRREGDSRPSFGDRRSSGPRREGDSRPSFGDRRSSGPRREGDSE